MSMENPPAGNPGGSENGLASGFNGNSDSEFVQPQEINDRPGLWLVECDEDLTALRTVEPSTDAVVMPDELTAEFIDSLRGRWNVGVFQSANRASHDRAREIAKELCHAGISYEIIGGCGAMPLVQHIELGYPVDFAEDEPYGIEIYSTWDAEEVRVVPDPFAAEDVKAANARANAAEARAKAAESAAPAESTAVPKEQISDGWDFLADDDGDDVPLWGNADTAALWQSGESLFVFGPPGAGKSTLAHLIVFARLGLLADVLGFPVTDDGRKVLYLAMDRPRQIKRAMRRLVRPEHERTLTERLIVHRGPLPVNVADGKHRDYVRDWARREGVGTVVVDSIKDVLPDASKEEPAGHYNQARQSCLAAGIEWIELHHNRKANGTNPQPNTLEDVYGSRWLTAGAGSVISLWQDEPGSPVISLRHIRTAGEKWRDTTLILDTADGTLSTEFGLSLAEFTGMHPEGFTVAEAAKALHGPHPTKGQRETIRNQLNHRARKGALEKTESVSEDGAITVVYRRA
jgi:hypothetical protein